MRLTTFTSHTIRTLIYLALERGNLVTIAEVAKAYAISESHLMKVVHQLGLRGYIETLRGKGGGLRLALEPAQINLGRVIRETEPNNLLDCMETPNCCRIQTVCTLVNVLIEAQNALYGVMDRYTLADLLHQEELLASLINPSQSLS